MCALAGERGEGLVRFTRAPHAMLVLGSGLGGLADDAAGLLRRYRDVVARFVH